MLASDPKHHMQERTQQAHTQQYEHRAYVQAQVVVLQFRLGARVFSWERHGTSLMCESSLASVRASNTTWHAIWQVRV